MRNTNETTVASIRLISTVAIIPSKNLGSVLEIYPDRSSPENLLTLTSINAMVNQTTSIILSTDPVAVTTHRRMPTLV